MHYLTDIDPIKLLTDASDYGVGGYLFQTIDAKEVPVAFVSKSVVSYLLSNVAPTYPLAETRRS